MIDFGRDFEQHVERLIRNLEPILARRAEEERQRAEAARQAEEDKQLAEAARHAEEEKRRAEAAQLAREEGLQAETARRVEEVRQQAVAARQAEEGRGRAEAAREAGGRGSGTRQRSRPVQSRTASKGWRSASTPWSLQRDRFCTHGPAVQHT